MLLLLLLHVRGTNHYQLELTSSLDLEVGESEAARDHQQDTDDQRSFRVPRYPVPQTVEEAVRDVVDLGVEARPRRPFFPCSYDMCRNSWRQGRFGISLETAPASSNRGHTIICTQYCLLLRIDGGQSARSRRGYSFVTRSKADTVNRVATSSTVNSTSSPCKTT